MSVIQLPINRIVNVLTFFSLKEHAEVTQFLSKKIREALFSFEEMGKSTYLYLNLAQSDWNHKFIEMRKISDDHVEKIPLKCLKISARITQRICVEAKFYKDDERC